MKPDKADTDWRSRYLDALRSLEDDTRRFRAMEVILKRISGRLCIAAKGLSPQLDTEIETLRRLLKQDADVEALEKVMPALTHAINALDEPASATANNTLAGAAASAFANEAQLCTVLGNLLSELKRDDILGTLVNALEAELKEPLTGDNLMTLLTSVTDMVTLRIQRAERARQEAEQLLEQMAGRLDDISQYLSVQSQNQAQSRASNETLNLNLADEMKAMGVSVDNANDLQQLRTQVRTRLDAIDHHLQAFRQREAERDQTIVARTEQMQARVSELEAEASRLHTQLKAEQEASHQDALTRLSNRKAYDKRIEEELSRLTRYGQPCCLAAVDIDHFKRINDTWGHRVGDRVLQVLANRLRKRMRTTDFVARYGGEEFVMLLPGTTLDAGLTVLNELRETIAQLGFHFRGTPVTVTFSGGITALQADDSAGSAFERADQALYRAKNEGRNRCQTG